jgi:hypothetical protein
MQMKVDKTQFDELLGRLLKAKPLPKSAIPKKVRRKVDQLASSPQGPDSQKPEDQ